MYVCIRRMVGRGGGSVCDRTDTDVVGANSRVSVRLLSLWTVSSLGSDTRRLSHSSRR